LRIKGIKVSCFNGVKGKRRRIKEMKRRKTIIKKDRLRRRKKSRCSK
jgi:hypothetical protein